MRRMKEWIANRPAAIIAYGMVVFWLGCVALGLWCVHDAIGIRLGAKPQPVMVDVVKGENGEPDYDIGKCPN